jgi:hypothetical protein
MVLFVERFCEPGNLRLRCIPSSGQEQCRPEAHDDDQDLEGDMNAEQGSRGVQDDVGRAHDHYGDTYPGQDKDEIGSGVFGGKHALALESRGSR